VICGFAVAAVALGWARSAETPVLNVEIAFDQSACCTMQMWVNDPGADIVVLPIQSGKTHVYSTPFWASRVDQIRMPIGQSPGMRLVVRRIWVSNGSRVVAELKPAELKRLIVATGAQPIPDVSGAAFTAPDSQPFLTADVAMDAGYGPLRIFLVKAIAKSLPTTVFLLVFGAMLTAVVGFAVGRQFAGIVAIGGMIGALVLLPWMIPADAFRDPVELAVGNASYNGVSKFRQQLLFALTVAVAALIPVIAALAGARLRRRKGLPQGADPSAGAAAADPVDRGHLSRRASISLAALPAVIALVAGLPDLRALETASKAVYEPGWDANMFFFWRYLVNETELVAVKDYFWPYGFQWLFNLPLPWGPLIRYATFASLWALVGIGGFATLSRYFSGKALVTRSLLLSALAALAILGHGRFDTRYIAPTALVLLFAAIRDGERLLSWRRLLFAFALVAITLFELAQAIYALPAIVFLAATRVWLNRAERGSRQLLVHVATVGVPIAVAAAVFAVTGTLAKTLDWYGEGRALNAAYAFVKPIDSWAHDPADVSGFVYWAVPLGICLGVFAMVTRRGRGRSIGCVVVALGIASVMLMQKQVLRGIDDPNLWIPSIFVLVFWAASETLSPAVWRWVSVGAVAGVLAAVGLSSTSDEDAWRVISSAPRTLAHDVGFLADDRAEADEFAAERFAKLPEYQRVVDALKRNPRIRDGAPVWTLGDDAILTVMMRQSWPYYFSDFYDSSPIAFQHEIIDRLTQHPPERVVFNSAPSAMTFDAIPNIVRVPLLFQWAVEHLVPAEQVGTLEIMRRRSPGEPIALAWWRERIGTDVNLGHLPRLAKEHGSPCTTGSDCGFQLQARLTGTARPPSVTIPLEVGGLSFSVTFDTSSGTRFMIPLDRLWFWNGAAPATRRVLATGVPGVDVVALRRTDDHRWLY
jgi:hypothetical protein